jgi:hypothetical protein
MLRLLDLAALDPRDLFGCETGEVTLTKTLLEAQPTQRPAERAVGLQLPSLRAPAIPVVELVQDRVCSSFVVAQTDRLSEVRDRDVRDIGPGAIGTGSEPPERCDQWLEVSAVEDDSIIGARNMSSFWTGVQ